MIISLCSESSGHRGDCVVLLCKSHTLSTQVYEWVQVAGG